MRRAAVATAVVLAGALALTAPRAISAHQHEKGMEKGPCMGMMHEKGHHGTGPGMGMMHGMGMGPLPEKLTDADRGDLLVLQGKMFLKRAELMQKQAEAVIAEGERLQKKAEK